MNPTDCEYERLKDFHPKKKEFYPQHLDLSVSDEKRKVAVEIMYNVFKNICEASNANLIRNAEHLIASQPSIDSGDIVWLGESEKRFDDTKFKLCY